MLLLLFPSFIERTKSTCKTNFCRLMFWGYRYRLIGVSGRGWDCSWDSGLLHDPITSKYSK